MYNVSTLSGMVIPELREIAALPGVSGMSVLNKEY